MLERSDLAPPPKNEDPGERKEEKVAPDHESQSKQIYREVLHLLENEKGSGGALGKTREAEEGQYIERRHSVGEEVEARVVGPPRLLVHQIETGEVK